MSSGINNSRLSLQFALLQSHLLISFFCVFPELPLLFSDNRMLHMYRDIRQQQVQGTDTEGNLPYLLS
jgi:hypothetical protein